MINIFKTNAIYGLSFNWTYVAVIGHEKLACVWAEY